MERSHGQLCTGFTDGLSGDNANCLTDVNRSTASQITTVTSGTNAVFGFASQNRTDFNLFDTGFFNNFNIVFVNQLAFLNQNLTGFGMNDVFLNGTSQNSLADGYDNVTAVDNRTDNNASFRTAVGSVITTSWATSTRRRVR